MRPTVEDDMDEDFDAEEENKLINEEYKVWKKNSPYLYDLVIAHALDWPSLTCQWFPDSESPQGKSYTTHRLLLGTHTSGQSADYLQIATVQIPNRSGPNSDVLDRSSYDDTTGELGGHTLSASQKRVQITQRICHEGEINRARYMPQNPDLIATKTVTGKVFVFDRTKHGSDPDRDGVCKPDIKLVGQEQEGYGIAWSPQKAGHILSSSNDMTVAHWDINAYGGKANNHIQPLNTYRAHGASVGDVDWHATQENVFASVGDDKMLMIWDTRSPQEPSVKNQAHDSDILAVAFSPASEHILITGSADTTIALHDLRNPMRRLHTFEGHTSDVLHLAWSPHEPTIFASASGDRRINIYDLSLIGQEQSPDDAEDGAPELLFVHGGHTAKPADFGWAPGVGERWTAVSVSEDNICMVWTPTARVWASEEVRVDERELEGEAMDVEGEEGVAKVEDE